MNGASDQLFARARLPLDQDNRIGLGSSTDAVEHIEHLWRVANDRFKTGYRVALLKKSLNSAGSPHFYDAADQVEQFFRVDWLG